MLLHCGVPVFGGQHCPFFDESLLFFGDSLVFFDKTLIVALQVGEHAFGAFEEFVVAAAEVPVFLFEVVAIDLQLRLVLSYFIRTLICYRTEPS